MIEVGGAGSKGVWVPSEFTVHVNPPIMDKGALIESRPLHVEDLSFQLNSTSLIQGLQCQFLDKNK